MNRVLRHNQKHNQIWNCSARNSVCYRLIYHRVRGKYTLSVSSVQMSQLHVNIFGHLISSNRNSYHNCFFPSSLKNNQSYNYKGEINPFKNEGNSVKVQLWLHPNRRVISFRAQGRTLNQPFNFSLLIRRRESCGHPDGKEGRASCQGALFTNSHN